MNRKVIGLTVGATLTCLVLLGVYTIKLWFSESLHPKPGSYAFLVTITDAVISDFPIVEPATTPTYTYSSADGPKPAIQKVTYISRLKLPELSQLTVEFSKKQGFALMDKDQNCTSGSLWKRNEEVLEVCINEVDHKSRRITVQLVSLIGNE